MQHLPDAFIGIVRFEIKSFKIENYFGHVFFNAFYGAEFVLHAFDLYAYDCHSGKCRQQHSAKRVPQGNTISAFKRFDDEPALAAVGIVFESNFWCFDFHHDILFLLIIRLFFKRFFYLIIPGGKLLRIQFDDKLFVYA